METIQSAVDAFREAAQLPEHWPRALQSLSDVLGSDGATLVLRGGPRTDGAAANSQSLLAFLPEYMQMPFPDSRVFVQVRPQDGFLPDHAHFSRSDIAIDPFYQEFLIPRGFGCHAVARLATDLDISLKRSVHRGQYDDTEVASFNKALPWLRAASRVAMLTWRSHFSGQLDAFERLGRGALLIDKQGRVLQTNGCTCLGDGLDTSKGSLKLSRSSDRHRLERFLAAVLHTQGSQPAGNTTLIVGRPSGRRPLVVDGISCSNAIRSLHSDAAALLLITNLEQPPPVQPAKLVAAFGLTTRESELALQIAVGRPLKSAAATLGISEQHARQRLKDIYKKTDTSGKGELIAMLSRL